MSMQSREGSTNKREILDKISEEAHHRPVVPFLGAGISIAAGFPTIRFLVQYLAKVDFAIKLGVFADRFPSLRGKENAAETYRRHPSKYLEDFGWPDLGQLDADLWTWLGRGLEQTNKGYCGEGRKRVYQDSCAHLENRSSDDARVPDLLSCDINPDVVAGSSVFGQTPEPLDLRDHLRAIVQWTLRHDLADRESGTALATLEEWQRWKTWYFGGSQTQPELLYGDWEPLLDRLCRRASFDLTDALFTSFEHGRSPTLSHRYLAFLQRKLGMPLVLTTNFDSLLERALREEGVSPKVFDVHRDAELPDASLVHRQFSILKLHGSAYGLRLGERLRYPLIADARSDLRFRIPAPGRSRSCDGILRI